VNPSPEVEAVIRRFLTARSEANIGNIRNVLSNSSEVRLIGTDEEEWAQGSTVPIVMGAHWEAAARPTGSDEILRLEAFENGDTAWAAVESRRIDVDTEQTYRITFVLVLEAGAWKMVQIHYSVPTSNEGIFYDAELSKTLSDLLHSLERGDLSPDGSGEYGTSTIVFTDVVGSTALSNTMGSRVWSELIIEHLTTLGKIVEKNGGSVVKTLGDGGMYAFTSASSALVAAAEIQKAVATSDLEVRIGAHTGDVFVDHNDYVGLTVAKAARVAAAADAGQILVSESTFGMVNPAEFQFDAPVVVELKGLEGTHQLHPLIW
jgi:class 3 adenylate cyclase